MFYAGYILAVKGLRDRGETTLHLMAVTTTITALVLFPVALASGEPMLPETAFGWWILIGLALVSHAAGQGLIAYALAHLPAAFSSVSLLFQPVMAALFAWVLLAEPLVPLQIAGGVDRARRHLPRAPRVYLDHDTQSARRRALSRWRRSRTPSRPTARRWSAARLASRGIDHDHHADAAVEHAVHLVLGDVPGALQPLEDSGPRPERLVDHGLRARPAGSAARCR